MLADTEASLAADNHVLEVFGGKPVSLKTYRETIIIPSLTFYTMHGVSEKELAGNPEKWGKVFHEFYEERAAKCRSRKGAKKLLQWLNSKNIGPVILSNHTMEGIELQLKRLGIERFFLQVLANPAKTASLVERNKQKKLANYIETNNYKKDEAIIIGDSPEEIEMGKSVGIRTIAITHGYYSTARLKASKPDFLINNLLELAKIIQKIEKNKKAVNQ